MKPFERTGLLSSVGASALKALAKRGPMGDDASPEHDKCDCGHEEDAAQDDPWRKGFTRRRLMQGGGMVLAAPLVQQLVTTRLAFAQTPGSANNLLVVVYLRGGIDGLNVIVPNDTDYYGHRDSIAIPQNQLLQNDGVFGLNPALAPLEPFWTAGTMGAVQAVGMKEPNYSHFDATYDYEKPGGGRGWINALLEEQGLAGTPTTPFQAAQILGGRPYSFDGVAPTVTFNSIEDFRLNAGEPAAMQAAIGKLYNTGGPIDKSVQETLAAVTTAAEVGAVDYVPAVAATYDDGGFYDALREVARIRKADVGLRVANIEIGGWDTHTDMGNGGDPNGNFNRHLAELASGLAAFANDLGPLLATTNIITTSEFGRRPSQNDGGGTDHGFANMMLLIGGGVNGGQVHGQWPTLADDALRDDNLASTTNYQTVIGELLRKQHGLGNVAAVLPDYVSTEERNIFKGGA